MKEALKVLGGTAATLAVLAVTAYYLLHPALVVAR